MSDDPNDPFRYRYAPDGIYASCVDQFSSTEDSLSQMRYGTSFTGLTESWPDSADSLTTHFVVPGKEPPPEVNVALFGQVVAEGTSLGAMGTKRGTKAITLATKVRDKIALGLPTGASDDLKALYFDQIETLNETYTEFPVPGLATVAKYSWTTFKPSDVGGERDVILITLPFKYAHGAPTTKLRRRQSDMDVSSSKSDEVSEDGKYEPSMMPDYDPAIIQLGKAHLVQQKMYDQNARLVPPWKAPEVFAPGTLVVVDASLVIYHFLGGEDDKSKNHRFQILAHRIAVLDPSPLPYKPVTRVALRKAGSGSQGSLFDKILGPHAKRKAPDA